MAFAHHSAGMATDEPTLADHPGWWVEARCSCGRCTHIPVTMLLREWRRETEFTQIARRLRCRTCSRRPIAVELVEDIQAGAKGTRTAPGPRISLLP
jgi:cytochrome c-type biogenesis protein CcmH/NrfF